MPRAPHKNLNTSKMTIITPAILAKEFKINKPVVINLIAKAKVKPHSSVPYATGYMHMYERAAIQPLVEKYIERETAKIKPASAPPAQAEAVVSLSELAKHLAVNDATLEMMREAQVAMAATQATLLEQNKLIFQKLQAIAGDVGQVVQGLVGCPS